MTRVLKKMVIGSVFAFLVGSCNIKAPLDEILPEGNATAAPYIELASSSNTINIQKLLPNVNSFDSITSTTLSLKASSKERNTVTLLEKTAHSPIHQIHIWKHGQKSTLIAVAKILKPQQLELSLKNYLNNVIFVNCNKNLTNTLVLWQNTVLPDRFVSFDAKGISIFIPKEAKSLNKSTLRIFAQDKHRMVAILTITLSDGIPTSTNH